MNKKFRKAVDANAMVIAAAVGVLILFALYCLSKDTMTSISSSQNNMGSAITEGLEQLKK